jgi:hypothetical protein
MSMGMGGLISSSLERVGGRRELFAMRIHQFERSLRELMATLGLATTTH